MITGIGSTPTIKNVGAPTEVSELANKMRAFVYILKSESGRYYIVSAVSLVSRMR